MAAEPNWDNVDVLSNTLLLVLVNEVSEKPLIFFSCVISETCELIANAAAATAVACSISMKS